jgi:ribonuclease Z
MTELRKENGGGLKVWLLGTGGPELTPHRQGAATLVEAGGQLLLFDAGRGVLQRLYECRVPINHVTRVFLTHLHSDHIEGLPSLWITPWFLLGRSTPMSFWGPVGTREMLDGMRRFLGHDVVHRVDVDCPAEALEVRVEQIESDGLFYDQDNVSIRAISVDHKDGNPSFGFRIDHGGRSVLISGDCTFSEDLIKHGEGADIVIHNVFAPSAALLARDPHKRKVAEKLSSPEQAAEVFRRTRTRHGFYTHVIRMDSSEDQIIKRTRSAGFTGPLTIGEDGMVISVGQEIIVAQSRSTDNLHDVTKRGDI